MKIHSTLKHLRVCVVIALASLGLGGCLADLEGSSHEIELAFVPTVRYVDYSVWSELESGCDGALADLLSRDTLPGEIVFARAEGEESLGVILHEGIALCVDTWEILEQEAQLLNLDLDHVKGDPSPDPMLPMEEPR